MDDKTMKVSTVPICCYCDADLSCARCGREQPQEDGAADAPTAADYIARRNSIVERLRSNYASSYHGGCQNCYGIVMDDAADEIERLTERCSAYKGQVEAGAAEIAPLKARVAELESRQKDNSHG